MLVPDIPSSVYIPDSKGSSLSYQYLNIYSDFEEGTIFFNEDGSPNYLYNHHLVGSSSPISNHKDYILNGGFEFDLSTGDDGWTFVQDNGLHSSYFRTTNEQYVDKYSGGIGAAPGYKAHLEQDIILNAGIYSVVGYVKNNSYGEAYIEVSGESYGGEVTVVDNDNEWAKVKINFVVESDNTTITVSLYNDVGGGSVYFDGIQLYEGFTETQTNLIENASFEYIEGTWMPGWETLPSGVYRTSLSYDNSIYQEILGSKGIAISGDSAQGRSFEIDSQNSSNGQVIEVSSTQVTVGGWAKSYSGTPTSKSDTDLYNRYFRIRVGMYSDSDVQLGDYVYVDFDPSVDGWQFNCNSFDVETGTSYLRIWIEYQGEGYVYFDNLSAYEGSNFSRYIYDIDENGAPVTTIVDTEGTVITYTFDADDTYCDVPLLVSHDGITTEVLKDSHNLVTGTIYKNVSQTVETTDTATGTTTVNSVGDGVDEYFSTSTKTLDTHFDQYMVESIDEFGNTTYNHYDTINSLLMALENAEGVDKKYVYDDYGNLERVEILDDYVSSNTYYGYVVYGYDSSNRIDKIWLDYDSSQSIYYEIVYDNLGRMDKVLFNSIELMDYDYLANSSYETNIMSEQEFGNGDILSFGYNSDNLLTSISLQESDDSFATLLYGYVYSDDDTLAITITYDPLNSSNILNREYYIYDSQGRIERIFDEQGNDYRYSYDSDGHLTSLDIQVDTDVSQTVSYNYTDEDQTDLISYLSINGNSFSKDYIYTSTEEDYLRRLERIQLIYDSELVFNLDYELDDFTTRINDIVYTFSSSTQDDIKLSYSYDTLGNITKVIHWVWDNSGSSWAKKFDVEYVYDELNQLIKVHSRDENETNESSLTETNCSKYYTYDIRGNLVNIETYYYKQIEKLEGNHAAFRQINSGMFDVNMYYNGSNNYNDIYELDLGENPSLTFTYYNDDYQTWIQGMTTTLQYSNLDVDNVGYYYNQYRATDGGFFDVTFRVIFKVGDTQPAESLDYTYDQTWIDLLKTYDIIKDGSQYNIQITYEENNTQGTPSEINEYIGSTLQRTIELEWSGRNLASYEVSYDIDPNVHYEISFTYNDDNIRTSKSFVDYNNPSNNYITEYTLVDNRIVYETDQEYGIYYTYDDTGKIVSFNYDDDISTNGDGDEYFYIRNYQGDVIAITDSNGDIEVEYTYDAWGNIVSVSDTSGISLAQINPIRYRGYYFDEQMGWYYLQSRYYNPESCRFINNDVMFGGFGEVNNNLFSYTYNNPINNIDEDGFWGRKLMGGGIQIYMSLNIYPWFNIGVGIEAVWYNTKYVNIGSQPKWKPFIYIFFELGFTGGTSQLIKLLKKQAKKPKFISISVSISGFMIWAYKKKFKSPMDYEGPFSTVTLNVANVRTYWSTSDKCKVVGGGYNFVPSYGLSGSQSMYFLNSRSRKMLEALAEVLDIDLENPL